MATVKWKLFAQACYAHLRTTMLCALLNQEIVLIIIHLETSWLHSCNMLYMGLPLKTFWKLQLVQNVKVQVVVNHELLHSWLNNAIWWDEHLPLWHFPSGTISLWQNAVGPDTLRLSERQKTAVCFLEHLGKDNWSSSINWGMNVSLLLHIIVWLDFNWNVLPCFIFALLCWL